MGLTIDLPTAGLLGIAGAQAFEITANTSMNINNIYVCKQATSFTVTLPTTIPVDGGTVLVKNVGTNATTVASTTIEGTVTTHTLNQDDFVRFVYINATQTAANFTTHEIIGSTSFSSSTDFLYNIPAGMGIQWNQIVFTVSKASSEKKLFVNGVQQGGTQSFTYWNSKNLQFTLGVLTAWVGIIRIYSDVLTDAEVLRNYNANKASYGLP